MLMVIVIAVSEWKKKGRLAFAMRYSKRFFPSDRNAESSNWRLRNAPDRKIAAKTCGILILAFLQICGTVADGKNLWWHFLASRTG
jgi:hypothetical protein